MKSSQEKSYYVQFAGDYSMLKEIGYSFQKLYANNYQQWNNGEYRVWRKGNKLTHDQLGDKFPSVLTQLLTLDIENIPFKQCKYFKDTSYFHVYIHRETYDCTFDPSEYKKGRKAEVESYQRIIAAEEKGEPAEEGINNPWMEYPFTPDSLAPLFELIKRDWVKINCHQMKQEYTDDFGM